MRCLSSELRPIFPVFIVRDKVSELSDFVRHSVKPVIRTPFFIAMKHTVCLGKSAKLALCINALYDPDALMRVRQTGLF